MSPRAPFSLIHSPLSHFILQFIRSICKQLIGKVNPEAFAISLIKVHTLALLATTDIAL
jgi:hypothetical protein